MDERNQRQHKQIEKYTMLLDWKNKFHENKYTTQSNLQIQCNPYQITNSIFHRTRTKILKFVQRYKRTKAIFKKKTDLEESGSLTSGYTIKLQSSNQYYGTGTKREYRSMEQDRKPRNKPTHLWSINLQQRRQEYTMEVSSISGAEKT